MLSVNAYVAYAAEVRYLFICLSTYLPVTFTYLAMLSFACFIMIFKAFSSKLICSKKCATFSVSNAQSAKLYMLNPTKKVCHFMCEPLCEQCFYCA